MASTLVRGKYVIGKITGPASAEVVSDGAVLQRDGEIIEVDSYEDLRKSSPSFHGIPRPLPAARPGLDLRRRP